MTWIKSVDLKQEVQIRNRNSRHKSVRDGPWAWLVAFASALGLSVTCSFFTNNGLFYTYMVQELGIDFTLLTLIGSINTAIGLTGAVVAVQLIERFDVRPVLVVGVLFQFFGCFMSSFVSLYPLLFISMAVVLGMGSALSYVTFIVAVDKYFDKKKSIAMPLATSGGSLSGTIFSPICERLLEHYGFHGAMLIYSAVFLNCLVCAALILPLKSKESQRKVSDENPIGMSFCRRPSFILYMLTNLLYVAGNFIPNGLLPETALSKGVTQNDISLTFSVSGITQVIGRLMFGFLSHRLPHHIKYLWIIYLFGFALSLLIVPLSTAFVHFLAYGLINGIFNGGANMGYNLTLGNIVEPKHYGRAISLALVMQGLGALVGNPFAAFLKDVSGSGDMPYYFGCLIFILSGLVLLPISNINQAKSPEIEITVSEKEIFETEYKRQRQRKSNNIVKNDSKPDGGWGWIVTCAMCLCLCLSTALRSSIGILYTYMIDEFGFDLTVLSLIGSINGAVSYTGAFFTVSLIERFGVRRVLCVGGLIQFTGCLMSAFASSFVLLLISLSIITGLGNALTYVTGVVAIDAYFDKKKSIAVSLATTGISLSRIIFPSTVEFLLSKYGFSDAMMIFSAILLNLVVCGAVVFPQRLVSQEVVTSKAEKLEKDMAFCKNTGFILYVLASFLFCLGVLLPVGFIPETASARGVSVASVSLTFVGSGIMDILGRISFGIISHRYSFYVCKIWSACLAGFGLSMLIVPFSNQLYQFLLFNLLNGLLNGGVNLGYALAIKNITEPKYYGRGISMSLVMQGLGLLAGNPLAAYLQEVTGNENVPYYFGTIIFIMTALVLLPFSGSRQHEVSTIEIKVSEHHLGENDSKH